MNKLNYHASISEQASNQLSRMISVVTAILMSLVIVATTMADPICDKIAMKYDIAVFQTCIILEPNSVSYEHPEGAVDSRGVGFIDTWTFGYDLSDIKQEGIIKVIVNKPGLLESSPPQQRVIVREFSGSFTDGVPDIYDDVPYEQDVSDEFTILSGFRGLVGSKPPIFTYGIDAGTTYIQVGFIAWEESWVKTLDPDEGPRSLVLKPIEPMVVFIRE